jgi:hypothetical protein
MYHELEPLRQALSDELRETLPPVTAGVDQNQLLQTLVDRLTLYLGCAGALQSPHHRTHDRDTLREGAQRTD